MRVKYSTARRYNPHFWPAFWRYSVRLQAKNETCSPSPCVYHHIDHFFLLTSITHSGCPPSRCLPVIPRSNNEPALFQTLEKNLRPAGCSSGLTKGPPAHHIGFAEASRGRG